MSRDADKTKEQLLAELAELRKESKEQQDKLKAASQQLEANIEQLRAAEQQSSAASQQQSASEEKYRLLFRNMIDGLAYHQIVTDEHGKAIDYIFMEINDVFEELTGLRREKIIGKKVTEALPGIENDPADWIGKYGEVALSGKELRLEQYAEPLGKWYSVHAFSPKKGFFATIFEDITQRKQAEEALRESEEKFRKAFSTTPDSININRLEDGLYISINDGFTKITGYSESDVIGKTSLEVNIWDNPGDREKLVEGLHKHGQVQNFEAQFCMKDGKVVHGLMSAAVITLDGVPHIISITKDITQHKQAEEELRESEMKFKNLSLLKKAILESPEGIIVFALDKNYCYLDFTLRHRQTMKSIWGVDIEIGSNMLDYIKYKPDREKAQKNFDSALKGENLIINEEYGDEKLKRTFYENRYAPIYDENNNIIGLAVYVIDITERKRAEKELRNAMKNIERSNEQLEEFTYVASHDLQEPLRTINSFTELLENQYKGQLDGNADKYLHFLSQASTRMSALVKGLLDYNRIGHSKQWTDVDCNAIIEAVQDDLTSIISETKTTLDIGKLPIIKGYETELRQLFQNLISNAIKYREKDVAPQIKISAQKDGRHWRFSFRDNGIGIAEEHKDRIFLIFQRLHNRSDYEGTGIGLALCRKIVDMHGGKIWVESQPHKGSTFYVRLKSNKK